MPLTPRDSAHKAQIAAGTAGRRRGHRFERVLALMLEKVRFGSDLLKPPSGNIVEGNPALELVRYIVHQRGLGKFDGIRAWWVGGLATSNEGDELRDEENEVVTKCKSDIVVEFQHRGTAFRTGVSTKTCNAKRPTNAQLFFTTATAFCDLLRQHDIGVSADAEEALRMFCGDPGYRPQDCPRPPMNRLSSPERWYWEELPDRGRSELESTFADCQDAITTILLQKAYLADPYPPSYVLHQTRRYSAIDNCELALYSIPELVHLSSRYAGFQTRSYRINKGRYKEDPAVHEAPRFGIVQFQRGGQKQHPTQLQFNLKAGYFYHLAKLPSGSSEK